MVIYLAKTREVVVINGQGTAPMAATPAAFAGKTSIPANGPLAATIPAVVDAASLALAKYGTKSLGEVLAPAIRLADGFPMYEFLSRYLTSERRGCEPYAATMRTYYPEGRVTKAGEMFRQPNLARTLRRLVEAEAAALKAGEPREKAIGRARDAFYTGDIARQLAAAVQAEGGMITEADLANYHSKIEQPYSVTYRGYTVHKAGPWNQSPVLLQTLNLLEGFDLRAMGHLSAGSIHVMTEAMKLAYADRDRHYGDPAFVKVPMTGLLSKAYAESRRALIDPMHASLEQRPGNPLPFDGPTTAMQACGEPTCGCATPDPHIRRVGTPGESGDTTAIEVVDKDGNLFSATPSSGWLLGGAFVAGDTGVPTEQPHAGLPPRARQPQHRRARQAAADDPHADDRDQGRRAVPGHRHTRRRQPGSADPAGARQRDRLRPAAAGGRGLGALQHAVDPELVRRPSDRSGRARSGARRPRGRAQGPRSPWSHAAALPAA